jgi:hypothetical protein
LNIVESWAIYLVGERCAAVHVPPLASARLAQMLREDDEEIDEGHDLNCAKASTFRSSEPW